MLVLAFLPMIQPYSCGESLLWLGKVFLCLHLPKDHPFWTAKENSKITELRTAKVTKAAGDDHGIWNYGKLAYNTKFPWEASAAANVESEQYVLSDFVSGIQFFSYDSGKSCHRMTALNLADFPVKYGLMRGDKIRWRRRPAELTLGAYGFPDNGTSIIRKEREGAKALI